MEANLVPQEQSEGPSIEFLKTPSGVLLVVNFILCFISWCIIAGWRGDVGIIAEGALESETGYFLFTTVTPWLLYIIIFIMLVLQLQNRININWPLAFSVNCALWAFLLFIASCVVAARANSSECLQSCGKLRAGAAFGFILTIGFVAQAIFHVREFKRSSSNPI